jgi:UDP-N-acetylmuramoyl-tripeptide--D-alanyl-D-alanine ligase
MITIPELYQVFLQHPSVTTDTRLIKSGDLFFALKGPSFNGNAFAQKALELGAAYAVIDDAQFAGAKGTILVEDVLSSLQQLAKYHREQLSIPVLAITGSNGKTTTKELVHAVLSQQYKTYTTEGNLNNHIGIPLTLLRIQKDAELAVVEMGANHLREIANYCQYALPTHGLITNCGKAHLEGFGSMEGVRKGKGELFDFLRETEGTGFICRDFDYFLSMSAGLKEIHWYGTQEGELVGQIAESEPFLKADIVRGFDKAFSIQSHLVGGFNMYNILAACAVGRYFKVPPEKIKSAIENYVPSNSRSQLLEKEGNKIILDAYNANPSSMQLAIDNFARLNANQKIVFLGAMKELGPETDAEHQLLVDQLKKYSWKDVILVGKEFERIDHPYRFFTNVDEAATWWKQNSSTGNYLLVKGSRSTRMEKILD